MDETFAAAIGTRRKALAPFGSGTLLDVVLGAIAGAGIADIAVVGDDEIRRRVDGGVRVIAADDDGSRNILHALDAWPAGDDLLFATCDLPFARDADLRAFLTAAAGYDLCLPLATATAYEAAYPGAPPHVTVLGRERIAGGSVFFIGSHARAPVREVAGEFFRARKSALAMARLLGGALLLRFIVRRLRVADIEHRAERVLGVRAAAIRAAAPGLCFDVDTLADYRYACERR